MPTTPTPTGLRASNRTNAANERRRHVATAAAASASPPTKTLTKTPPKKKLSVKQKPPDGERSGAQRGGNVGRIDSTTGSGGGDNGIDSGANGGADGGADGGAVEGGGAGGDASGGGAGSGGDSGSCGGADGGNGSDDQTTNCKCNNDLLAMMAKMEERVRKVEEEGQNMQVEIWGLRDRLEEEEHSEIRLEQRTKSLEEEAVSLKEELEKQKDELKRKTTAVASTCAAVASTCAAVASTGAASAPTGTAAAPTGAAAAPTGAAAVPTGATAAPVNARRYIVVTDSNGRGATQDSIKNHIPRNEKDSIHIEVAVAYTTTAAINQTDRGMMDVRGATVVLDNLTNDVRGTQARPALTPEELVCSVDRLRERMKRAGAVAIIVCQIKPMQLKDVTPYNNALSDYLRPLRDGFGCRTQIRLDFLRNDGFHIQPTYDSTLDKTYACAIRGVPVPCPTPFDQFVPSHLRRRWETEWPRISEGQGQSMNHG